MNMKQSKVGFLEIMQPPVAGAQYFNESPCSVFCILNLILIFCGNWKAYLLHEEKVISFHLSCIQDS